MTKNQFVPAHTGYFIRRVQMTQEELGKLLGVQKAQISRLEKSSNNVTLDTLIRVFRALNAKVVFQVELPEELLDLNNSENSNF